MIRIRHVHGQDVTEDGGRLTERDAVVLEIRRRLRRIPLEAVRHVAILSLSRSIRKLIGITRQMSRAPRRHDRTDGRRVGSIWRLGSRLLKLALLERAHIGRCQSEPLATLALCRKAFVPVALDRFRVVGLDDVYCVGPLWQLNRQLAHPASSGVGAANLEVFARPRSTKPLISSEARRRLRLSSLPSRSTAKADSNSELPSQNSMAAVTRASLPPHRRNTSLPGNDGSVFRLRFRSASVGIAPRSTANSAKRRNRTSSGMFWVASLGEKPAACWKQTTNASSHPSSCSAECRIRGQIRVLRSARLLERAPCRRRT